MKIMQGSKALMGRCKVARTDAESGDGERCPGSETWGAAFIEQGCWEYERKMNLGFWFGQMVDIKTIY